MKKRYGIIAGLVLAFSVISFTGIKAYEHHGEPCGQYVQKHGLTGCYHQQQAAQRKALGSVYAKEHHGKAYAKDVKIQYQGPCFDADAYDCQQNAYTKNVKSQHQGPCFDADTYDCQQSACVKNRKAQPQKSCLKNTGDHHQTYGTSRGSHHRSGYHHHS